jgi:hypothetical protein
MIQTTSTFLQKNGKIVGPTLLVEKHLAERHLVDSAKNDPCLLINESLWANVGQLKPNVCWPNVCWPNVCWPNVSLLIVYWANVCWPNPSLLIVYWANVCQQMSLCQKLVSQLSFGQMSVSKMSLG